MANADEATRAMWRTLSQRRAEITRYLWRTNNGTVLSGPFAGMQLSDRTAWGDGDLGAKILGCYEMELWPHLREFAKTPYRQVINIGCAEGYYAVGLAMLLPQARVQALDELASAQEICRQAAALYGVADRIEVGGRCSVELLATLLAGDGPRLLIMDCEGAEDELLDPARLPCLSAADLIVECHDFIKPGVSERLRGRLAGSHRLVNVVEGARNPNAYSQLRGLASIDRWLIVSENRPCTMNWLVGYSLARERPGQGGATIG